MRDRTVRRLRILSSHRRDGFRRFRPPSLSCRRPWRCSPPCDRDMDVISFRGEPAADGAADALLRPNAHDNRCRLVHLVSSLGHTNRKPLERRAGAIAKRWEAEDFAAPSTQDKLPTIEARRDSSIQLPSGSRIIDIRATLPSVTGARPSRTPLLRRSLWTVSISATCRVM